MNEVQYLKYLQGVLNILQILVTFVLFLILVSRFLGQHLELVVDQLLNKHVS